MAIEPSFTPTQQKIITLLSDGEGHSVQEILGLINPLNDPGVVRVHIYHIRKVLRNVGQDITLEMKNGRVYYRHVRLLNYED